MGQYLIDNNIISSYFSGLFPEKAMDFIAKIFDQVPNISVITEIEALSWVSPVKKKEVIIQSFINDANILTLSQDIVLECIKIRRSKKIKTPDAIIAATAIVYNLTLLSTDSDFNNVNRLKVINPFSLV